MKCDPIVCPPTNCSNPIIEEGSCCATCSPRKADGRGCHFGEDSFFHPAGSKWHPYIPPYGFSRCVVCTCKVWHQLRLDYNKHLFHSCIGVVTDSGLSQGEVCSIGRLQQQRCHQTRSSVLLQSLPSERREDGRETGETISGDHQHRQSRTQRHGL